MTTNTLASAIAPVGQNSTFPVTDFLRAIVQGFTAWRARCDAVQHLHGLNDAQLRDIGVERCDIERAVVSGLRSSR